jgi:hypothetical protein
MTTMHKQMLAATGQAMTGTRDKRIRKLKA